MRYSNGKVISSQLPGLRVFLWNVEMNELEYDGCKFVSYADDIVLTVSGKFIDAIRDGMQLALKKASEWASELGLGVSSGKT